MEVFFMEHLQISSDTFRLVVLPILIFFARIMDVSIATLRIVFVMGGKKLLAPILGFFEAFIWLLAIGQIFSNIDSINSYIGYALGFAAGTFIGMLIEEKLALGHVVVRTITKTDSDDLCRFLRRRKYRYANIPSQGPEGDVNVVFAVVKRDRLNEVLSKVREYNPHAFYTVEGVKSVKEFEELPLQPISSGIFNKFKHLVRR
ncbi:MAG: DUF2179 domain-containing protein [Cyclobacteriaceae bacterium]|nr:DUF2179 domain-containing protein [Cyclobacteriaceae bacterium]MCH8517199.1 DUF2179 domain-containing protein [Cyclobacteriaceae bacterium]